MPRILTIVYILKFDFNEPDLSRIFKIEHATRNLRGKSHHHIKETDITISVCIVFVEEPQHAMEICGSSRDGSVNPLFANQTRRPIV